MKGLLVFLLILCSSLTQAKMLERRNYDIDSSWDIRDQKSWTGLGKNTAESFNILFQILDRSATARSIIAKAKNRAKEQGSSFDLLLNPGETSLCDMSLVRRFSPNDPSQIHYETKSKIYLNRHLKVLDGALDLIHELTHYSYRQSFNPYQLNFTLPQFISSTIEGRGGEVDAYMVECQVLSELAPKQAQAHSVCSKIRDPKTNQLSRYHATKEFYKVGNDYRSFWKKAKTHQIEFGSITTISDDLATFISSAYNTSYPLAAILEYEQIMDRACTNDMKRMALFSSKIGRFPASADDLFKNALNQLEQSYRKRCHKNL